jgi:hypothetical protein
MIVTILNIFALFVATCAVMIFAVIFAFFLFIMYACIYIGWREIKGISMSELWERIQK